MAVVDLLENSNSPAMFAGTADTVAKALSLGSAARKNVHSPKRFVALELPAEVTTDVQDALVESLQRYLVLTLHHLVGTHDKQVKELMMALTPIPALPQREVRQALADAKIRRHVLTSETWLTASEVADMTGSTSVNRNAQTSKWKRGKKIFSIVEGGVDRFPAYAFDPDENYRPRPAMQQVISAFGPKWKGWNLAIWFASANAYLDGKQPQELIADAPDLVIEAAKDKAEGIQHG